MFFIHQGQLLNPVLMQDPLGFFKCGPYRCGDQILLGHYIGDGLIEVLLKYQVTISQDPDQSTIFSDRHPGDAIASHDLQSVVNPMLR